MTEKRIRKVKTLKEQLEEAQQKVKKVQQSIEKYKHKTILNFFNGLAEEEVIFKFIETNAKNKEIQEVIHTVIKDKILELNNNIEDKENEQQ